MKKTPGFFTVGLLLLFPALLLAQDDSAPRDSGSRPGLESGPGPAGRSPEQGPPVTHAIGFQYSSMTGFLPSYRLESTGPLVGNESQMLEGKLTNDFSVLGDMLNTTLATRFNITPMLSLSLEVPASAMYRYPADFGASIAGSASLSLSNRPDPRDQSPGWVLSSAVSSTATSTWTNAQSLVTFGITQPDQIVPYQAEGMIEVGYMGRAWSSGLKLVATDDLTMLASLGLTGSASVTFGHVLGDVSLELVHVINAARFNFGLSMGCRV